jgi:hypothetical protein
VLILRGIEVLWNQQLWGGFVSVDLSGVAGRDLGELMQVLLIKGLGGNLSWKFGDELKWRAGGGESWRSIAEDIYNVNS